MPKATLETTEVEVITIEKKQVVNLQLSIDEALLIKAIMGSILGESNVSPRGMCDDLYNAIGDVLNHEQYKLNGEFKYIGLMDSGQHNIRFNNYPKD